MLFQIEQTFADAGYEGPRGFRILVEAKNEQEATEIGFQWARSRGYATDIEKFKRMAAIIRAVILR